MTTDNASQRLVELQEVPQPVFNSLYLALTVESGHTHVSYHKAAASEPDIDPFDESKIRILNLSEPASCVCLRFGCSIATQIDEWNGDASLDHPLAALGLRNGRTYQVLNSEWLKNLQCASGSVWAADNRKNLIHFVCAFRINVVQVAAISLQYFEGEAALQAASTSLWRPKSVQSREA